MGQTCCRSSIPRFGFFRIRGGDETYIPYSSDYFEVEPYLTTFRLEIEKGLRGTILGEVDSLLDLVMSYVEPQVAFRFQVLTNEWELKHDALVLWDDGMVQCEDAKNRWWLRTDFIVSVHVLMAPLLEFSSTRHVVNCLGWNTYASHQKWLNFQAVATLPKFKRVVASNGPDLKSLSRALDFRKRSFYQLYQMVRCNLTSLSKVF